MLLLFSKNDTHIKLSQIFACLLLEDLSHIQFRGPQILYLCAIHIYENKIFHKKFILEIYYFFSGIFLSSSYF